MDIKKTTVNLDMDVYNKIKKIANREDRNVSQQINYILKQYLKNLEKKE